MYGLYFVVLFMFLQRTVLCFAEGLARIMERQTHCDRTGRVDSPHERTKLFVRCNYKSKSSGDAFLSVGSVSRFFTWLLKFHTASTTHCCNNFHRNSSHKLTFAIAGVCFPSASLSLMSNSPVWETSEPYQRSPIAEIFQGILEITSECTQCRTQVHSLEPFFTLK